MKTRILYVRKEKEKASFSYLSFNEFHSSDKVDILAVDKS